MPRDPRLYLDDMLTALGRIRGYVEGMEYVHFAADQRTIDAVVRNLEIVGEAARALPDDTKAAMREIEWRKIVGLRNLLTHEYFGVSTRVLWDIVTTKLASVESACRKTIEDERQA